MSNKLFQYVDVKLPGLSGFSLTHNKKLTCKVGYLVPNLVLPVSPGDAFRGRTETFMRFQPMLFPLLHEVDVYQRYFFVPYRLICSKWPEWWAQENGNEPGDVPEEQRLASLPPFFTVDDISRSRFTVGSLADHLGYPPIITYNSSTGQWVPYTGTLGANHRVSALPVKAYNLIWNEYYRDQNLEDPIELDIDEMGRVPFDTTTDPKYLNWFSLKRANWEKDYFTSSLPNTQKGSPVTVGGLVNSGEFPVEFRTSASGVPKWKVPTTGSDQPSGNGGYIGVGTAGRVMRGTSNAAAEGLDQTFNGISNAAYDPQGTLKAVLNMSGQPYTVEALNMSIMLQRYYELQMRGGSRYVEQIRNLFGVTPDDLRIGRPKYLGGGMQNVMVSEVVQQSGATANDNVLGDLAGKATSIGNENTWKHYVTEHGLIMGIMSVVPRSGYGQGLPKEFWKEDPFDFLNPRFDHLGEQPVRVGELYYDWSKTREQNAAALGYMPNYMEYRTIPDQLAGKMRTDMSSWHMNRIFDSQPVLNSDFIKVKETDVDRVFAVDTSVDDPCIVENVHHISAIRPLSKYGTPML